MIDHALTIDHALRMIDHTPFSTKGPEISLAMIDYALPMIDHAWIQQLHLIKSLTVNFF